MLRKHAPNYNFTSHGKEPMLIKQASSLFGKHKERHINRSFESVVLSASFSFDPS